MLRVTQARDPWHGWRSLVARVHACGASPFRICSFLKSFLRCHTSSLTSKAKFIVCFPGELLRQEGLSFPSPGATDLAGMPNGSVMCIDAAQFRMLRLNPGGLIDEKVVGTRYSPISSIKFVSDRLFVLHKESTNVMSWH